ncbi:MAG: hypothetical protein JXC32_15580, partial [Anaerolineae bacterium]|nr:hypothetical protein [Anaerolineae bacterium]
MTQHTLTVLADWPYEVSPLSRGYTGRTLYVNVSDRRIEAKPVSDDMRRNFVGGRGFDLWLLWHGVQ